MACTSSFLPSLPHPFPSSAPAPFSNRVLDPLGSGSPPPTIPISLKVWTNSFPFSSTETWVDVFKRKQNENKSKHGTHLLETRFGAQRQESNHLSSPAEATAGFDQLFPIELRFSLSVPNKMSPQFLLFVPHTPLNLALTKMSAEGSGSVSIFSSVS